MIESMLKKLNIKTNPNKVLTYFFFGVSLVIVAFTLFKLLMFLVGHAVMQDDIYPFMYAVFLFMPVLGYAYSANSGITKDDKSKIKIFFFTAILIGIIASGLISTWINSSIWYLLKLIPTYDFVYVNYFELFSPAIKTLTFVIPFIAIFQSIDFFLVVLRDDDLPEAIAGFKGLDVRKVEKEDDAFCCSTVICKNKETNLPVIVPEKKRYESTLVQGATGTGKTATVLLPMSAFDLERKYFFREYSKKLGYSLLKRGLAYVNGPYDNEFINKHFSLEHIRPRRGMEDQYFTQVKKIIQYRDKTTGEVVYRNLGITIVENDGKFISDFTSVAKNFGVEVLSVDPGNEEETLSINPFAIPEPSKVASIIADVLKSMYEDQGGGAPGDPFFTQVTLDAFQNLAILLKEMYPVLNNGNIASLEDMLELLYNFDKVEAMAEEMKKVPELEQKYKLLIAYFEKNFYKPSLNINGFEIPGTRGSGRKETEKFLYGAITQLNNLLRHPGLKKALCGKANILNFDKILEGGQVVTACSRKGELGIIQSKAFGMFFIMQFQDSVLRRKGNEDSRTPHFLYIDEFPEYINKDMEVMFTLFRKYRCGVTIAIQNLSQLEKSGKGYYRQVVLANTKTQIVFGDTVPEDSEYWSLAFGKDKVPDSATNFSFSEKGEMKSTPTLTVKEKERAKGYKIANLGFGAVYYKTKDSKGSTVFGKGKTTFLESKYKSKHDVLYFNFEKYMMSKPDNPSITLTTNDNNESDDELFGVSTTTKLMDELKSSNILTNTVQDELYANKTTAEPSVDYSKHFEIEFEDLEPTLDNMKDGGAITETYETPTIKRNN